MNNKIVLLSLIMLFGFQSMAQVMNSVVVNPDTKTKMLIGYCNEKGLEKGNYGIYFKSQYDVYKPSEKIIKKLSDKLNDIEITIVLGTWCSDSQREVPRFYKVLKDAGYNTKRVKVIAVNKNKEAIVVDIKKMDIVKVPTFIIYKNDVEIGRIIETPNKSLEKDFWNIVK